MTTGGTESIIMACKAYRDYCREAKGIARPNMVIARTAHSGFDKAAQYLGIHVTYVDVDADTTKVNIAQMKRKINKNTIMVSFYRAAIATKHSHHARSEDKQTPGRNVRCVSSAIRVTFGHIVR